MAKRDRQFYINAARQYAIQEHLPDPRWFLAMLQQEANFNPGAVSYAGARGIGQIMPFHDVDPTKPGHQVAGKNPLVDLKWAAHHLAENFRKYGSMEKALSVYNSGQPDKYLDPNFAKGQTYNYVRRIKQLVPQFQGGAASGNPTARGRTVQSPSQVMQTPPMRDDSSLRRQALLSTLVGRQNAYLSGEDYDGPSALQALSVLRAAQPMPQPVASDPGANGGQTQALPLVQPMGKDGKPLKGAALMATLISRARQMGLRVSENAKVDHVDPVHTKGSDHYRLLGKSGYSAGLDVGGSRQQLTDYFNWASRFAGHGLKDLFFDPMRYSFDNGKRWNKTIGGHGTHVHASVF